MLDRAAPSTMATMTKRPIRRRAIAVALAGCAVVAASAFFALGPALAATEPTPPADTPAPRPAAHIPAIADPAVSGTDLEVWISGATKTRHDTAKNTIQNAH